MPKLLLLLFSLSLLCSCEHEPFPDRPEEIVPGDTVQTVSDFCHPDSVYFVNHIYPIIDSKCQDCHDAFSFTASIDYTNYWSIMYYGQMMPYDTTSSFLFQYIKDSISNVDIHPMIDSIEMWQIGTWIHQGAKNNSCYNCDTVDVSFTNQILPIIELQCQGCHHGDAEPDADLSLTNYDQIKVIVDNEKLIGVLTNNPDFVPMPYDSDPLHICDRDAIIKWIEHGALNN